MDAYPEKDEITTAFRWECSTRRAAKVLALKRQRMREDLQQTIEHLGSIVPPVGAGDRANDLPTEIVRDAPDRLGDRAFAEFVLQVLQE